MLIWANIIVYVDVALARRVTISFRHYIAHHEPHTLSQQELPSIDKYMPIFMMDQT